MASCDDDFSLLGNDDDHHHHHHHHHNHLSTSHHHHHQSFTHHGYLQKSGPIHPPQAAQEVAGIVPFDGSRSSPRKVCAGSADSEAMDYATGNEKLCSNPLSSDNDPTPFEDDSNPNKAGIDDSPNDKRKDRDDYSDGGVSSNYKKSKSLSAGGLLIAGGGGSVGGSGMEYRKDRDEWNDSTIECLLEAYTEKYTQLNKGNLRGRDWEEVEAIVSKRCENQSKTVEQCKNKVDNLKKRYRLERHRMSSGGISTSHWPWFKRMETIVGNSVSGKATSEDDKPSILAGSVGRQPKRKPFEECVLCRSFEAMVCMRGEVITNFAVGNGICGYHQHYLKAMFLIRYLLVEVNRQSHNSRNSVLDLSCCRCSSKGVIVRPIS